MASIPYASVVNLMYTRLDIAFVVRVLGKHQSNLGIKRWKVAKKVMRYLQGTKGYKLTYKHSDNLAVVGYTNLDFVGCVDIRKSASEYIFRLIG